ncbi:MAG: ABC transporter permease [Crenarchaeota archaeon]|nr:ABC transporter permease [Thermoproteota archaeon]MDW8033607.1 ABC transporter permease [Nitrososphaerota archaeon]
MWLSYELKVVTTVVKKELVLYFRYPVWVLFDALMPLLWVLSLVIYGMALVGSSYSNNLARLTNTGDYISFTVVGMIVSSFAYSTLWGMSYALRGEQWSGTLESTFLTPCSRFSILLGKALSSMLTTSVWVIVQITLVTLLLGLRINFINLPLALLFFLISLPSFIGIGFSLAGIVLDFKEHSAFVNFLSSLLGLLLPISYPLNILPPFLRYFSYALPPTYAIEGMRSLLVMGCSLSELIGLIIPLVFFDFFWLIAGVTIYLVEERKVLKNGTLGYY